MYPSCAPTQASGAKASSSVEARARQSQRAHLGRESIIERPVGVHRGQYSIRVLGRPQGAICGGRRDGPWRGSWRQPLTRERESCARRGIFVGAASSIHYNAEQVFERRPMSLNLPQILGQLEKMGSGAG